MKIVTGKMKTEQAYGFGGIVRSYSYSVAAILMLFALAKVYTLLSPGDARFGIDPVFKVPVRGLLWITSVLELTVVSLLLFATRRTWKLAAILWMGVNFAVYRFALHQMGAKDCPCLGRLGEHIRLSANTIEFLTQSALVYMLVGASLLLGFLATNSRGDETRRAQQGARS